MRPERFDETDAVAVGETTTDHVRVRNQGTSEDLDVGLVMNLPEQLEFVSGDGPSDVRAGSGGEVHFAPLEQLDASSEAAWTVELRAVDVGETVVSLELRSQATPGPVREEEATRVVQ